MLSENYSVQLVFGVVVKIDIDIIVSPSSTQCLYHVYSESCVYVYTLHRSHGRPHLTLNNSICQKYNLPKLRGYVYLHTNTKAVLQARS